MTDTTLDKYNITATDNTQTFAFSFCQFVVKYLQEAGISREVAELCSKRWKDNTNKCNTYMFRNWFEYCAPRKVDPFNFQSDKMINFLRHLFQEKTKSINYVKSHMHLFSILRKAARKPFTENDRQIFQWFLEACFNEHPEQRNTSSPCTWDMNVLLEYIESLGPNKDLTLTQLSRKVCTLLMIATFCRKCKLTYLNLDNIIRYDTEKIIFKLTKRTKSTTHIYKLWKLLN